MYQEYLVHLFDGVIQKRYLLVCVALLVDSILIDVNGSKGVAQTLGFSENPDATTKHTLYGRNL